MNYRTRTIHSTDVDDTEVELQYKPCDWMDMHKVKVGNKLVVAYNVLDDDYRNIDDLMGDCMGSIVDAYNGRDADRRELYELAGYDRYGDKDLDAVWDKHEDEAIRRYVERIVGSHSDEDTITEYEERDASCERMEGETAAETARRYVTADAQGASYWTYVMQDDDMQAVLDDMWDEPAYWPGNPDAVFLDVYDHSGQSWSITGGGMQCRWDTSSGAGAWVPDKCLLDELEGAQRKACFAYIRSTPYLRGRDKKYQLMKVLWDGDVCKGEESVQLSDDFAMLVKARDQITIAAGYPSPTQTIWGRRMACEIYAQQFLDTYNEIISGNIYGCVCEVFDDAGEQVDDESCWGFIGSEYAEESLKSEFFDPMVSRLTKEWEDTHEQA